jgi:glutaredoxin 2
MLKLYVYDHCPFCVRARMPFGFKDIPFELVTLLNDDVATPTAMIGQKMVPILEREDGSYLPESMDICRAVDREFGEPIFAESANRSDLMAWTASVGTVTVQLCFPRWTRAPLAEFATPGAVAYFTRAKTEWIGPFDAHLANSAALKAELNAALAALAPLIQAPHAVNGQLSEDDIDLFGKLRGLTIVAGIDWPAAVRAYLETMSAASKVPLYDDIAIA